MIPVIDILMQILPKFPLIVIHMIIIIAIYSMLMHPTIYLYLFACLAF